MTTIIERIRAEIEGWMREYAEDSQFELGERNGYKRLLSFLSDLEKEEKPSEGLEEELKDYFRHYYNCDYPKQIEDKTCSVMMIHLVECARHFAQWQKDQMMKEAVEGRVISNDGISFPVSNEIHRLKLIEGDKVKLIIVKED